MRKSVSSAEEKRLRRWSMSSIVLAGIAVFVALGGTAVAANGLIHAADIASGAVTGKAIKDGSIEPKDLSANTRATLAGGPGKAGTIGAKGETGSSGAAGQDGAKGASGTNGTNGVNGANGPNGPNGANGIDGTNGIDGAKGTNGTNGINGTNGTNGTISPLSAKQGLTALPTGVASTTVVELAVPAGNYVILAKTELSHTGAGDSVECALKAGSVTLDQVAMKTLPALAAIPASLQAVTTVATTPTVLSIQCGVAVANGSANFTSLIAIPTA